MSCNVLIYLSLINFIYSTDACLNFNVSITQIVEREGFKRDLRWSIEIASPDINTLTNLQYALALRFVGKSGTFVNPNEVAELRRFKQLSAYIEGDINVEASEHESREHMVYVFVPVGGGQRISVTLPISLRYQRARIEGGFAKVRLAKPSLLAFSPNENPELCEKLSRIDGPCDDSGLESCPWRNTTYQALFDDVDLFVPVGNLDDYPVVAVVTLLLGCCGCIYIFSILSTAPL